MTSLFLERPAAPFERISAVTDTLATWLPSEEDVAAVAGWNFVDWQISGWVAYWQSAIPWLAEHIRASGVLPPKEIYAAINSVEADSRKRTQYMLDNAVELLQALAAEGIKAVLLKGAVLAATYYPDHLARPMADLDILVKERELRRCTEILDALGYRFYSRSAEDIVFLRGERKENIWAADNVHPVEVHFTLREEYAGIGYDLAEEMWAGSRLTPFWGELEALLPQAPFLLHHVCAHATSDWLIQRGRLMQIDDIRRICAKMEPSEWQLFAGSIPPSGARFVYPALAFADRYARLTIPPFVHEALRANCPVKLLEWIEATQLSDNSESNPADRSSLGFVIAQRLSRSTGDRLRFWLRSLFPRRWNLAKRYPRLVETPFWPIGYLLINVDRLYHVARRRFGSGPRA
jgi:hypothetical protein